MRVITVAIPRTSPTCLPSTLYLFVVISAPNAQAMQSKSADASELSTIDSEETPNTFCPSTSRTTAAKAAPIKPIRYTRALFIRAPYHNRFVASPNCGQPRHLRGFSFDKLRATSIRPKWRFRIQPRGSRAKWHAALPRLPHSRRILTRARGAALMMVLAARREAVVCDSTPVQQLR